jgi:hypothetical protein
LRQEYGMIPKTVFETSPVDERLPYSHTFASQRRQRRRNLAQFPCKYQRRTLLCG